MDLKRLKWNWDAFGKSTPLEAILTNPQRKEGWREEEFFEWGRDEIEGVLEYLRSLGVELKRGRALDFGCGVGRLTQALAAHFEEVHGVDIAPSMIGLADRYNRYGDRCRYHLNDSEDLLIFDDDSFDFVYSNITLQHMEPRYAKGYLREFLRVLKTTGLLVFQLPTEQAPGEPRQPDESEVSVRRRARQVFARVGLSPLARLYRRARDARSPSMEMYGIPKGEVVDLLFQNRGRVLDVQMDRWATGWLGFRYCVTKMSPREEGVP